MMRLLLATLAGLAACAFLACGPYDPDLGEEPFRCGTDEPRCPEGYAPVEETEIRCVCVLEGEESAAR